MILISYSSESGYYEIDIIHLETERIIAKIKNIVRTNLYAAETLEEKFSFINNLLKEFDDFKEIIWEIETGMTRTQRDEDLLRKLGYSEEEE